MRGDATNGSPGFHRARGSLAGTRFLAAFENADERLALQAVARRARVYQAGVDLAREGEVSARLLVVTDGWAYRYKTTREGCRQIVTLTVPGEVANLDALMFERPDFAVRSLTPVTVVTISCEDAHALAAHHAGISKALIRMALTENAILCQRTLCLGRQSAQQRLAHFLCEMGERLKPGGGEDGISFDFPLTQAQIADTIGLTPVHVNRTFQQLRREGLVKTSIRAMAFPDLQRLRALAEFDGAYLHKARADRAGVSDRSN